MLGGEVHPGEPPRIACRGNGIPRMVTGRQSKRTTPGDQMSGKSIAYSVVIALVVVVAFEHYKTTKTA